MYMENSGFSIHVVCIFCCGIYSNVEYTYIGIKSFVPRCNGIGDHIKRQDQCTILPVELGMPISSVTSDICRMKSKTIAT